MNGILFRVISFPYVYDSVTLVVFFLLSLSATSDSSYQNTLYFMSDFYGANAIAWQITQQLILSLIIT